MAISNVRWSKIMPLQVSTRVLYRVAAVACAPVAVYNYVVWFENPDTQWETAYLKSLVGAVVLTICSIVCLVLSIREPDRMITLCGTNH